MITGSYPCCNATLYISLPEVTPAWACEPCEHCGAVCWHYLSRARPASYTEAQFEAEFIVDHETKAIKRRHEPEPLNETQKMLVDIMHRFMVQSMVNDILGVPTNHKNLDEGYTIPGQPDLQEEHNRHIAELKRRYGGATYGKE